MILDGEPNPEFNTDLSPNEIAAFEFAPITTCDVERSFSVYKSMLADNRKRFLFKNLRKLFVIRCNFRNDAVYELE